MPSVRTYWSETRSEKTGSGPSGRPGSTRRIWARWARTGRSMPTPAAKGTDHGPAASDDVGGTDAAAVCQDDTVDAVGRDVQRGDGGVLAQAGPAAASSASEGHARSGGRRRSRRGARRRTRRSRRGGRPATAHGPPRGPPARPRCRVSCCMATLARSAPRFCWPDPDQVAGLGVARRRTQDLGRVLEHGQGAPGHGGQRRDAVVAAHDAARLAAAARADGVALEHQHVGHSELDQGPGRAEAGHAATDHHDLGRAGRTHETLRRASPGSSRYRPEGPGPWRRPPPSARRGPRARGGARWTSRRRGPARSPPW